MTHYRVADPIPEPIKQQLAELPPALQQLLANRGFTEKTAVQKFLEPSYEEHLHDPWLLNDMEAAVVRILEAIEKEEQIVIYSDYDCDGIPGAVIAHDFFTAIGYSNFSNHIPHRHYDGFGLSVAAVEKLAAEGVELIITIDCGTSDSEAVARANELGVDVIITDHHEPAATLPEAVAVVNPKVSEMYPFDGLCGAAVFFKLIQALLEKGEFAIHPGKEKWWLDMVGVATIADMVPLRDENRVLAHYGLTVLRKSRRPGLQQLLQKQRVRQQYLTEDDIGFTIGPRINAASRMDTPDDAFHLLAAADESEAGQYVERLEHLNNERKGMVAAMTKELHKRLNDITELPPVLVFGDPNWRPSLVGLVANKLAEEYKRPAFLWGRDGNGIIKGSCRSDGTVSVVNLMAAMPEVFSEYGGHHQAGGFAVVDQYIYDLPKRFSEAYESLGEAALVDEEVLIDASLTLEDITPELLRVHRTLAPFGLGNEKPLYEFKNVIPRAVEQFGKGKDHLKLLFTGLAGEIEAIAFYKTPADFHATPEAEKPLHLIGHIEESFFMGRTQTRIRIIDIL